MDIYILREVLQFGISNFAQKLAKHQNWGGAV